MESVFLIIGALPIIIIIYGLHKRKETAIVLPSSSRLSSAYKKRTIAIMGAPGSGKSTLRKELGRLYNVSTLELDTVHFVGEDWKEHPKEVMRQKVRDFIHAHQEEGWVIDGNYKNRVGDIVLSNADVVIFLHYNIFINLWRVCIRSIKRIICKEDLFGNNHETW
jgi:adenylate kinase family enzyme